ncbi:MAG TPA: hypothetical protein VE093_04670 [Polyangiaceae bacterium]|jgi:hypothetical protein|nr:hypothetical protein [Polyangiaceae bacterium]
MKRLLALLIWLLALLAPAHARAGTPYTIRWFMVEYPSSCEHARITRPSYFKVNYTPVPTSEVPGAYKEHPDGSESNEAEAPFDSVLLDWGKNHVDFEVYKLDGDNRCVDASEIVHLVSAPLGLKKPLFDIWRNGTAFKGTTTLNLGLEEINPPLARDIANLEAEIEAERMWLIGHAAEVEALSKRLDMLRQLETELHDLVTRPLDEIAGVDLDAIFDRYADVIDDATRAALKQLLEDLKKSIVELENELASLIDQFGAQADAVVDLATAGAEAAGFDPEDPSGYALGSAETPWVEIPDVSDVKGAFQEGYDPYATYADAVLATLATFVDGGQVVARASFAANVRAWRENQAALEKALLERESVSKAETNAFLNAQLKVTTYLLQFMDASYWYLDSPVPADLRADVDGVLTNRFGPLAGEMKDNLNQWEGPTLDLEETQLVETIRAFAGAVSAVSDVLTPYAEVMQTLVHATSRIAIGFVPVVGPTLDLCEAVTGKMFCLPGAKELSTEERIFSAVGFGFGSFSKAWSAMKNTGINPGAKAVAGKVLSLGEEFALALQANRKTTYKTLRGAAVPLAHDFERKAGLYLLKDEGRALIGVGDDGVRKVLGIPKTSSIPDAARAPDFLSVTKSGGLALSEVKMVENLETSKVDVGTAVLQLRNAVSKLKELNLAGNIDRVEIIIPKGAKLGGDYGIKDGYLIIFSDGQSVQIGEGLKNLFIKVIQL